MTLERIQDAIRTLRVNARLPGMEQVAGGWSTDGGLTSIGEALRKAEATLVAFPKMLEALEAVEERVAMAKVGRACWDLVPGDIADALRAAREAVPK